MAVSAITDFRIQVSLFTNRKFRRLRSALGPGACMALVELWGYAAANEPDGALLGWSPDDVEVAANWDGIRGVFTQNLVDLRWLDHADGGGYLIHDWAENQPWIADAPKRSAHAKKAIDTRWERERAKREAELNDQNTVGIPAEYAENTPSLSSPSPSSPSRPKKTTRAQAPAGPIEERFARFWGVVRKKVGKAQTLVEFRKVNPDEETLVAMIAAMQVYAAGDLKFQKDPERWVKYRRWEDEAAAAEMSLEERFIKGLL